MKITVEEKEVIKNLLISYVGRYQSMRQAAASLKSVSVATVSNIMNGKFESVSDEMFRNIAQQVGYSVDGWAIVETTSFSQIWGVLSDSKEWKQATWIVGESGCGKSTTAKAFQKDHNEVFIVLCSEDMKKSDFVREMARQIGIKTDGYNIREILDCIITKLANMQEPLLIFDEGDKLTDTVFAYFISLYNRLEEKAGMVFLSTSYIQRRMSTGLRYNKKGYQEFFSRIGRKFYELPSNEASDVAAICEANGINNRNDIAKIIKNLEAYEFDLRRVKKAIAVYKRHNNR